MDGHSLSSTHRIEQQEGRPPEETSPGFHDPLRAGLAQEYASSSGTGYPHGSDAASSSHSWDSDPFYDPNAASSSHSWDLDPFYDLNAASSSHSWGSDPFYNPNVTPSSHSWDLEPFYNPNVTPSSHSCDLEPLYDPDATPRAHPQGVSSSGFSKESLDSIPPLELGGNHDAGDTSSYRRTGNTVEVPLDSIPPLSGSHEPDTPVLMGSDSTMDLGLRRQRMARRVRAQEPSFLDGALAAHPLTGQVFTEFLHRDRQQRAPKRLRKE